MTPDQVHFGQAEQVYDAARKSSIAPSLPTQNASSEGREARPENLSPPGSTRHLNAKKSKLKFQNRPSQNR